jgi:hypothetical protein
MQFLLSSTLTRRAIDLVTSFGVLLQPLGLVAWWLDAFKVQSSRFKVQGSRFKVQGSRFKVQGSRFKVQGSRFGGWLVVEGFFPFLFLYRAMRRAPLLAL